MEEIILNDNFAQYVETLELRENDGDPVTVFLRGKTVSLDKFFESVTNLTTGVSDLILPKTCRYVSKDNDGHTIIVTEDEPQTRTVLFDIDISTMISTLNHSGKLKEYEFEYLVGPDAPKPPYYLTLAFPYIVYICRFDTDNVLNGMKLFYRKNPITSLSDSLYIPNLTNISQEFNVCLGKPSINPDRNKLSLIEWYNEAMERFWRNSFNKDFIVNYQKYCDKQYVCDLLTWCYFSTKDPMFVFDVDWIPTGTILHKEINLIKSREEIDFGDLRRKVFSPSLVLQDEKKELTHSLVESTIIRNSIDRSQYYELCIGDELVIDDIVYYVLSFICKNGELPHIAILEDNRGNQKTINIRGTGFIDNLIRQLKNKQEELSSYVVNGVELKVGQFVRVGLDGNNHFDLHGYHKISSFRLGRDGKIETKLGRMHYLLENVPFEVITGDTVRIKGIDLIIDKEYYLFQSDSSLNRPGAAYTKKIYKGLDASDGRSALLLKFNTVGSETISNLNPDDFGQIIDVDNTKDIVKTYVSRLGFSILTGDFINEPDNLILIKKGVGCFVHERVNIRKSYNKIIAKKLILFGEQELEIENVIGSAPDEIIDIRIKNEITSISVPSFDIDIKFSIGDEIVIADWSNIDVMLHIWKIIKFEIEPDNILYITAMNDLSNIIKIPYVVFNSGKINVGYIRHITREWNGIKAGTLIKANSPKIPNFPKKDYVKIIGFITDTGNNVPLIYCSNLVTLWPDSSLSNFDAITPKESSWIKNIDKVLPPNESKLRKQIQPGDLMCFYYGEFLKEQRSYPILVSRHHGYSRRLTVYELNFGYEYRNSPGLANPHSFNDSYKYGIQSPRIADWSEFDLVNSWPNFHNGYTFTDCSHISF